MKDIINENYTNPVKSFINEFILEENILDKTSKRFEQKMDKIINDSNKLKENLIYLLIGQQVQERLLW